MHANGKTNIANYLYLIGATTFWGINFHLAKLLLEESSYMEAATWRYIFAVVPLVLISLKPLKKVDLRTLPYKGMLLIGFVGLFGFNIFFFSGMQYTSPINAGLIASLGPLLTIFLSSLILKTHLTRYHFIGAFVSMIGVLYLLSKGNITGLNFQSLNVGDLLILVANILFCLHNVWVKQYRNDIPNQLFTIITNSVCLFGFLCLVPWSASGMSLDHSMSYWLQVFGIGCLGTALAYILWNAGVPRIGADRAGIYMNIIPLATALFGIFLGETLQAFHFVSAAFIISGILISRRK